MRGDLFDKLMLLVIYPIAILFVYFTIGLPDFTLLWK